MSESSILIRCTILLTVFGLSSALQQPFSKLQVGSNAVDSSRNRIAINLIDVKCDKDQNGMYVTIDFDQPFGGVIYSQGYFNDPKCRYVAVGQNQNSYNFVVPYKGCGSKPSCAICDSIDNILVIQEDEEVQGEFDTARKISCSRTGIDEEKKVFFKPFIVDMLEVVDVPTATGGVSCWMDIQRGIFPKLTPIGQVIKIGEELTVLVYLRDEKKDYDLTVRNCWAYDAEDFDDRKTGKVQLSDASGCSMKRKLFGTWQKTSQTGSSGATLLLHNTLRAFKFPDESQVYLKCDIEICRGNCAEAICDSDLPGIKDCNLNPLDPSCLTPRESESTTLLPQDRFTTTVRAQRPFIEYTPKPIKPFITEITTRKIFTDLPRDEYSTRFPLVRVETTTGEIPTEEYATSTIAAQPELTTRRYFTQSPIQPRNQFNTRFPARPETTTKKYIYTQPPQVSRTQPSLPTRFPVRPETTTRRYFTQPPIQSRDQFTTRFPTRPETTTGKYVYTQPPQPTRTQPPFTDRFPVRPETTTRRYFTDASRDQYTTIPPKPTTRVPFIPSTTSYIPITPVYDIKAKQTKKPYFPQTYTSPPKTTKYREYTTYPNTFRPTTKPEYTTFKPSDTTTLQPINTYRTTYRPLFDSTTEFATEGTTMLERCYPGSFDPQCAINSIDIITFGPSTKIATTNAQLTDLAITNLPPKSKTQEPEATFSTEQQPTTVFATSSCKYEAGSKLDPRCPNPTPTAKPPTYLPPKPTIPTRFDTKTTPFNLPTVPQSQVTTKIPIAIRPTTTETAKVTTTTEAPTTTEFFICVPGSNDVSCDIDVRLEDATTSKPTTIAKTTTRTPAPVRCYPGSQDPRCRRIETTTKYAEKPVCSFGSTNPECQKVSTKVLTLRPQPSTTPIPTTKRTFAARCYPGSLDPSCTTAAAYKPTTPPARINYPTQTVRTTKQPIITTKIETATEFNCGNNPSDPRCEKLTTSRPAPTFRTSPPISTTSQIYFTPKETTTFKPLPIVTPVFRCYPGSTDPRCRRVESTTQKIAEKPICLFGSTLPECQKVTTQILTFKPQPSTTPIPITKKTYAARCYPGSLDPSCTTANYQTTKETSAPTARPTIVFTTRPPSVFSTRPTIRTTPKSLTFTCYPGSLDPRCLQTTTKKVLSTFTTTPQAPAEKSTPPRPIISTPGPFTTKKVVTVPPRISSPGPFSTRPPLTTSSTENPLCYPGSTFPECKSTFTTPSFCYPGSPDKRCPQLPPSFSTRQPATYLPPYPDTKSNRIKRQTLIGEPKQEIVKFSLSFKPFSLN